MFNSAGVSKETPAYEKTGFASAACFRQARAGLVTRCWRCSGVRIDVTTCCVWQVVVSKACPFSGRLCGDEKQMGPSRHGHNTPK